MASQPRILVGQVAAITGAARGIGKETARAFLREGMKVAIGDLDAELTRQTAEELGSGAFGFGLDVTRRGSIEQFVDAVENDLGPIDVWVNNAGIMPLGRFLDEDDATAQRMIDINLHGVIWGMKVVLPRMVARNRGHVVNVASQAGRYGTPGGATYSATKHAVIGLSESVRGELRHEGADVAISYVLPYAQHGAGLGPGRGARLQEARARGRRRGDRRGRARARGRDLGPAAQQGDVPAHQRAATAGDGGHLARAEGRPGPRRCRHRRAPRLRAARRPLRARPGTRRRAQAARGGRRRRARAARRALTAPRP